MNVVFDKRRDPLRRPKVDKVVGRGHFTGGGGRKMDKSSETETGRSVFVTSDDSD